MKVKPNALVIESGNLIERQEVLDWLKEKQGLYHLSLLVGAGEQSNQILTAAGYKIKFCPLGRVTETVEERELCEGAAKKNQSIVQDLLDKNEITARVLIPFDMSDDVTVPINGDVAMFAKYLGYDITYRLTTLDRVEAKEELKRRAALAFAPLAGENGVDMELDKIHIKGF